MPSVVISFYLFAEVLFQDIGVGLVERLVLCSDIAQSCPRLLSQSRSIPNASTSLLRSHVITTQGSFSLWTAMQAITSPVRNQHGT